MGGPLGFERFGLSLLCTQPGERMINWVHLANDRISGMLFLPLGVSLVRCRERQWRSFTEKSPEGLNVGVSHERQL